jgi:hypothetical protein
MNLAGRIHVEHRPRNGASSVRLDAEVHQLEDLVFGYTQPDDPAWSDNPSGSPRRDGSYTAHVWPRISAHATTVTGYDFSAGFGVLDALSQKFDGLAYRLKALRGDTQTDVTAHER